MGEIVGHWDNLTEVQKLTQTELLSGVIDTIIEEGALLPIVPFFGISGQSIKYNREVSPPSPRPLAIHEQLPWNSGQQYTQVEVSLTRHGVQRAVDNFLKDTYSNKNNLMAQAIREASKGMMRYLEDKVIYGDVDNTGEFDGLHEIVNDIGSGQQINQNGALSLRNLRQLVDLVKPNRENASANVALVMSEQTSQWLDEAAQMGVTSGGTNIFVPGGTGVSYTVDQMGNRQQFFRGARIHVSDYMLNTEALDGSNIYSAPTGGSTTSIIAVRMGQIMSGGFSIAIGAGSEGPEPFKTILFDNLENFDAGGVRMISYIATALGSTKSIARIDGITDAAVTL